jgi:hypothetical protein
MSVCVRVGAVCVHECVNGSVSVSACVSVCYNNDNFWEILCSAHPSGSKKELHVTYFCCLRLRFDSICAPVNKRFQR